MFTLRDLWLKTVKKAEEVVDATQPVAASEDVELPGALQTRIWELERAGGSRPALEELVQKAVAVELPEEEIANVLVPGRHWIATFWDLFALGEAKHAWSIRDLRHGGGSLGKTLEALEREGTAAVLALYLVKFIVDNGEQGEAVYQAALDLVRAWQVPRADRGRSRAEGEEEDLSTPLEEEQAATPAPVQGKATESTEEQEEVGEGTWLSALRVLNINRCHGDVKPAGWYVTTPTWGEEIYLRSDMVAEELVERLRREGLVKGVARGQSIGWGGVTLQAGRYRYAATLPLDIEKLRQLDPGLIASLVALYTGQGSRQYDLQIIAPTDRREAVEEESHPCPRCGKKLRKKTGKQTTFYVCSGGCGFAVQADESGRPGAPRPCARCGGDAYPTLKGQRVVDVCVRRCQRKEAA